MSDFPVNMRLLEKLLAECGGPDVCKLAVLNYCKGDEDALNNVPNLCYWTHTVWDLRISVKLIKMSRFFKEKHNKACEKSAKDDYRKAEPLSSKKLDILARHEAFYKVVDDMHDPEPVMENNEFVKKAGNKELLVGAIQLMREKKYFKEYMNGKKVKLQDIIRFFDEQFSTGNMQKLWHDAAQTEVYVRKALERLKSLTTNEEKLKKY